MVDEIQNETKQAHMHQKNKKTQKDKNLDEKNGKIIKKKKKKIS